MQAAIGSAQMDKLEAFCEKRKKNFKTYQKIFSKYSPYFILPQATRDADPAWFAYIITVKNNTQFKRNDLVKHLNDNLIETRYLFAGNITRQPCFEGLNYRIADNLNNTDFIMNNTFFLGTYPGLTDEMLQYIESVLDAFMANYK